MKIKHVILALIYVSVIVSCDGKLSQVLETAGENRAELLKVLDHYKNDSLKRKAALFLIENMDGKQFYTGELLERYDTLFHIYDSLHQNNDYSNNPPVIRQAMMDLQNRYGVLDYTRLKPIPDCQSLSSEYLIHNIDLAFEAWQTNPLLKEKDFSTFCEYVLPYRAGQEKIEVYRDLFYSNYCSLRDSSQNDTTALLKAFREELYINQHFGQSQTMWKYGVDPSVSQMLRGRKGSCGHTCNLYVWALRSCGIPIAVDYVPYWGNRGMGHSWNVLILEDDRIFPFDPFGEKRAVMPYKPAKVFRRMYSTNGRPEDAPSDKDVPSYLLMPNVKDVTAEYVKTFDVTLECDEVQPRRKNKYAVICVFDKVSWKPIYWGKIRGNKVSFENMAGDVCYLAAYYNDNGELIPLTNPFILTEDGNIKKMGNEITEKQSITISRKYPKFPRMDVLARKLVASTIEGSNTREFTNVDTLMRINTPPIDVNDSILCSHKKYQYVRCNIPRHRTGDLAEIVFYGKISKEAPEVRLQGEIIGCPLPDNKNTMPFFMAMDGNYETYFVKTKGNDGYVGLDLGKGNEHYITRVQFCPRSDTNFIIIGNTYELCYWAHDRWISLGQKTANSHELVFDEVPKGQLYILHNLTNGSEERPFTYENGKQVWW